MSVELEQKLQKRLDESIKTKENQQAKIKQQQNELQKILNKIPRRPRESKEQLDEKISKLEHKRTVTSISLQEEREILRQINGIKKSKREVDTYHQMEKQVQDIKSNLTDIRNSQKLTVQSIDEIEKALVKVRLANKLGCKTVQELIKKDMDCPQSRIGAVIGQNGSTMKQIMSNCQVSFDVNKSTNVIEITGTEESVQNAMDEIDRIIRSIEIEFEPSTIELLNYLTAKHVTVVNTLKKDHPTVYINVIRSSKKIVLRGTPENVEIVKSEILNLDLTTKRRKLTGKEFAILLGKKGTTIDRLVKKYTLSIEVNKLHADEADCAVTGPPKLVDDVLKEIVELLDENKEVIEKITVDLITKRILLGDSGRKIKNLQSKVNEGLLLNNNKKNKQNNDDNNNNNGGGHDENGTGSSPSTTTTTTANNNNNNSINSCYLQFDKSQSNDSTERPDLLVRTIQSKIKEAVTLTQEALKEIQDLVVNMKVDTFIAPRIIGKGGETIKKLTEGRSGYVEVNRNTGSVSLGATTIEERDAILKDVNEIIDSNQLIRLKANKDMIKAQLRELGRGGSKSISKEINDLAWVGIDDNTGDVLIRGRKDDIEKAKGLLEEFLANNHLDEISMTDEDIEALLTGGKGSKIMKMTEETGVQLHADKSRHTVSIKGSKEKVDLAKKRLDQFANGGDGYSVARLTITEQVVGVIVGKKGQTRIDLEKKHGGVSINISKSQRVTIRGKQDGVAACRVDILKTIASARVTQTLDVTESQQQTLKKKDTMKRISNQIPVHIVVSDGKATIKGTFYDVRDAVSLLNEQLTGEYKSFVELDAAQFSKVKGATTRDPSHFERMESAANAKVSLDLAAGTVVVSGKRSNVKKAKDQVYGFLSFILPGEIERLKISKPLQLSVGQATGLAEVSALVNGAVIYLDRDLNSLIVRSSDKDMVTKALDLLQQKVKEAEKLAYCLELPPQDAWLVPLIIGKKGGRIAALQKDSGCKIDVSSESRIICVVGDSEEHVANVRNSLNAYIEKMRKENVFLSIPEKCVPAFMGKGSVRIKEFSLEHGAEVQRVREGRNQFKITGDADKVEATKIAIDEWVSKWEKANARVTVPIEKAYVSVVLGLKGETARALEDEFGCKIDIDRKAMTCTLRGGDEDKREKALEKIQGIIAKEKEAKAEAAERRKQAAAAAAAVEKSSNGTSGDPAQLVVQESGSDDSLPGGIDDATNRSKEFPSQPVGVVSKPASGRNGKSNGKKSKPTDASVQGTEAGRNLFNLLVSEGSIAR